MRTHHGGLRKEINNRLSRRMLASATLLCLSLTGLAGGLPPAAMKKTNWLHTAPKLLNKCPRHRQRSDHRDSAAAVAAAAIARGVAAISSDTTASHCLRPSLSCSANRSCTAARCRFCGRGTAVFQRGQASA